MTQQNIRLPKIFRWILRRLSLYEREFSITGDYESEYAEIRRARGSLVAFLWLFWSTIQAVHYYSSLSMYWSIVMFKNYLKITFRNLSRQKIYAFINIAGLSVGIACALLIILAVQYEFKYESHHENAGRIFRINVAHTQLERTFRSYNSPVPLAPAMAEEVPEITQFTRIAESPYHYIPSLVAGADRQAGCTG